MRIGFSLGSLLSVNDIFTCSKILAKYTPDSIWIPETWGMDCGPVLSTISGIATKPKIGSSIINIYSRTPALIAMDAVTIDTISNGRLILGLGTSSQAIVEDWHGLKFSQPVQRMRESVEIIRQITSGSRVTYNGKIFHVKSFTLLIKPVREKIPIYIAAINEKMVDLAWEIGDGVIFYLRPLKEMKDTVRTMQNKRKIDVACQLITCVSEDVDEAIIRAKKTIAFYVSVGEIYRDFLASNGYERDTSAIFEEYKKSGLGKNYEFVSDDMVNSLAICGTPNEISKKLDAFVMAGIDLPILQFNPIGNVTESFELLISAVRGNM